MQGFGIRQAQKQAGRQAGRKKVSVKQVVLFPKWCMRQQVKGFNGTMLPKCTEKVVLPLRSGWLQQLTEPTAREAGNNVRRLKIEMFSE